MIKTVFSGGSCYSIFSFMCNVLLIVVCPFALFLLVIVFSVLLRYTDSDCPLWYLQPLCFLIGLQIKYTAISHSVDLAKAAVSYNERLRNLKVVLILYNYHVQPVI